VPAQHQAWPRLHLACRCRPAAVDLLRCWLHALPPAGQLKMEPTYTLSIEGVTCQAVLLFVHAAHE
jgi:hypothetical protein